MKIQSFFTLVLSAALLLLSSFSYGLPAEMEMDRLMLAAERKLDKQDFEAAKDYLDRIGELKLEPSPRYYYLSGKVAEHYGELEKAKGDLSRYVEAGGREIEFYEEALEKITDLEERLSEQQAAQEARQQVKEIQSTAGFELQDTQGQAYDDNIRKLYMGQDIESALVLHINSLLKSYVYMEGRVKNAATSNREEYSVSVKKPSQILVARTERKPKTDSQSSISVSSLDAFGVNPYVNFRCSKAADKCFIKHPVSGLDWMVVAYDESGAADLAQALTRLIKALQR